MDAISGKARYDQERKEQAEVRKRHVLAVAEKLFLEHGISHVTMNHVMTEAKVSRGTLYRYYNNIHEMAFDIEKLMFNRLFDGLQLSVDANSPLQLVGEILIGFVDHFKEDEQVFRYIGMFNHKYTDEYPNEEIGKTYIEHIMKLFMAHGITRYDDMEDYVKSIAIGNMIFGTLGYLGVRGKLMEKDQKVTIEQQLTILKDIIRKELIEDC